MGKLRAAVPIFLVALVTAGCGTGGIAARGDQANGQKLFTEKCASCHTLAAANAQGKIGPSLDDAFGAMRAQASDERFKEQTFRQVVLDQIKYPSQREGDAPNMQPNLVKGSDAVDVATYVAAVAGKPGAGGGAAPAAGGSAAGATDGKSIFTSNCASCHVLAAAGAKGNVGPNLDGLKPDLARVKKQVIQGGGVMPAFKGTLTDAQIAAVAKYVSSVAGK